MSKAALRSAQYSASQLMEKASLSFQTIHDYKRILQLGLESLYQSGFILSSIKQLKPKHVDKLVSVWRNQHLSPGTIKNRLSIFRFTATSLQKPQLVKSNQEYSIPGRQYIPTESKAITDINFSTVKDPYLKASFELQQHFGLRREEALKMKPHQADMKVVIELQASWTKGGIQRMVPILTEAQRACLERAKALVKPGESLIPNDKSYKQQRNAYDNTVRLNGYANLHGLRHAYAQQRYETITHRLTKGHGWKAPLAGGPSRRSLNGYEKTIDLQTRQIISEELGHSRPEILKSYCG